MKNFSFLIPCYNCKETILKNSYKLIKKIKKKNIKFEIIFINDGSIDNTLNEIRTFISKNKGTSVITYKKNLGKSSALKKGIKKSKYNIIVFFDSDLPYFKYFGKLIDLLKKGENFVIIDRRSIKSKVDKSNLNLYQIVRFLISKFVNYLISKLLIKNFKADTQSGLKGFKVTKNFKKKIFISNKFFLDAEIMSYYSRKNVKFYSIPISYKIPKVSSIKIFDFNNIRYIAELLKIIFKFQ